MQESSLNKLHLEDIKNPNHPSVFFNHVEYKILIYRLFENLDDILDVKSHSFVLDEDENIYSYNKENGQLSKMDDYNAFYDLLDSMVDKGMKKVEMNVEQIEELEENIYDDSDAIQTWFALKKEMVRIERILSQAIKTHSEFIKNSTIIQNDSKLLTGFEDIEEHLNRIFRSCSVNISKLDSIYSLYTTLASEKMNKTMFSLTVISAIFLPINLIVGFFGMNTEGLYFSGNPNGTIFVTTIMATILVSLSVIFFLKRKSFY